ncbi:MAG: DinB family protein [Brachymonas sp.]
MNANQHFQMLARYNVWATHKLLESVEKVGDEDYRRDVGLFFKSVHGTLNHLLVTEHLLWYPRFARGESPKLALDAEIEPVRERLAQALRGGTGNWKPLIESWTPERYEGKLSYTRMNGQAMSLPFVGALTHVFNHGTHHRGQITAALTLLGQPCPELDLVWMLQKESK